MKTNSRRSDDMCLSDWLPCSKMVKGVGIGACVKNFRGKMIVCSRFSDVSILEFSIREKNLRRMERSDMSNGLE